MKKQSGASTWSHGPQAITRRGFVAAAGLAGLPARSQTVSGAIEAYAGLASVRAGSSFSFHGRDPQASSKTDRVHSLSFVRIGWPDQSMLTTTVKLRNRSVPANASTDGCNWPAAYTLNVPSTWPSGLYVAVFGSGSSTSRVPFVVRPATSAAPKAVMVQIAVTTAQAYNAYGGKSLYAYNSTDGVPAVRVSFDRPHTDPANEAYDQWQGSFVRWLAREGVVADFCTSLDLHRDASVLTGRRLLLLAGHDEYWSREMRGRLDSHVAAGGNAAIFSGNTCLWQIRMEANAAGKADRRMVCYKSRRTDPDTRAAYKTTYWADLLPPYPENSTIGLSYVSGASWTNAYPRPFTPYVVQRAQHWALAGTGLSDGAPFGGSHVGYEIDALVFDNGQDGRAYATTSDASPATIQILALADATGWDAQAKALGLSGEKPGYGAISIHSLGGNAGAVFNGATCDWAKALQLELDGQATSPFGRITRNVLGRLSQRHQESAEVRQYRKVLLNGDGSSHFYTVGVDAPAGAVLDGAAFRAFPGPADGTVPVYRYAYPQASGDGRRYTYNLSANLGYGWVLDGVAFHAYAAERVGAAAVFQHHIVQAGGDGWRFLFSPRLSEPGWIFDGVAFFAPLT